MRIKQNRLRQCYHRAVIPKKDSEGNSYCEYDTACSFQAELWPAGGKLQAEIYGQRITGIMNCRIDGNYTVQVDDKGHASYQLGEFAIQEGNGVCLNMSGDKKPDYQIISIKPYRYLTLELERM